MEDALAYENFDIEKAIAEMFPHASGLYEGCNASDDRVQKVMNFTYPEEEK